MSLRAAKLPLNTKSSLTGRPSQRKVLPPRCGSAFGVVSPRRNRPGIAVMAIVFKPEPTRQNRPRWFYGGERKGMLAYVCKSVARSTRAGRRGQCWIQSLKYRVPNAPGQKLWSMPSGGSKYTGRRAPSWRSFAQQCTPYFNNLRVSACSKI